MPELIAAAPEVSKLSILFSPTTCLRALSVACLMVISGSSTFNEYLTKSLIVYWTLSSISTMFSSLVNILVGKTNVRIFETFSSAYTSSIIGK